MQGDGEETETNERLRDLGHLQVDNHVHDFSVTLNRVNTESPDEEGSLDESEVQSDPTRQKQSQSSSLES